MGKKLLTAISLVVISIMLFTACNSYKWGPVSGAKSTDAVTANGGFLVEKGDYIYYINGIASSTEDNTFGKPVQGALLCLNKNDLTAEPQVVIPRLMVAGDMSAGIYIYGDWIYYATPTTEKDRTGTVQSSYLDFCRTKLDGTKTEKFFHKSSSSIPYRYLEVDGSVYLVYYESNTVYSFNVKTEKTETIAETTTSYAFSSDENYPFIYYAQVVTLNEEHGVTATYHKIYKVKVNGVKDDRTEVVSGVPKDSDNGAYSSAGLTLTLLSHKGATLYYSCSFVDTSEVRGVYALRDSNVTDGIKNMEEHAVKISNVTTQSSGLFLGLDANGKNLGILYADTNNGIRLIKYDQETNTISDKLITDETTVSNAHLMFVRNDYLFYLAGNSFKMVAINKYSQHKSDVKVLTETYYDVTWYNPELIGNIFYYPDNLDGYNYVACVDITQDEPERVFIGKYKATHQEEIDAAAEEE